MKHLPTKWKQKQKTADMLGRINHMVHTSSYHDTESWDSIKYERDTLSTLTEFVFYPLTLPNLNLYSNLNIN